MKDFIKDVLWLIPGYLLEAMDFALSPAQFMSERIGEYEEDRQGTLSKALIFAGVSFGFWVLLTVPLFPKERELWQTVVIYVVPTLLLMVGMAAAAHVSSVAVGGKQSFHQTVILFAYFNGIATVVLGLISRAISGCDQFSDPHLMKKLIGLLTGPLPEWIAHSLSTLAPLAHWSLVVLSWTFYIYWIVRCWGAFREIARLSVARSAAAFVCTVVLCILMGWLFVYAIVPYALK